MMTSQQVMAMSEINQLRLADNIIFKQVSTLMMEKDRTNRSDPMFIFLDFLKPLNVNETLFMTSDFTEVYLMKTGQATFWNDELSTPGRFMKEAEGIETCKKFYERGMHQKQIAKRMQLLGFDWDEHEVDLHSGDLIFMYTDGLSEATDLKTEQMFDERRIEAYLRSNCGKTPDELNRGIVGEARAFSKSEALDDDITLLSVRLG